MSLGLQRGWCLRGWMLLALMLSSQTIWSSEATPTLQDKRLAVIRGTTPGIVIFDFGVAKQAGSPASASAASADQPASQAAVAAGWRPRWLSALPAPSGKSLQEARRLDAPDQGIPLPTAAAASKAGLAPRTAP